MFKKWLCTGFLAGFAVALTSCISLLPELPTVTIRVDREVGVAPFEVAFQTTLTMPKADPKEQWRFEWDFGDGETAEGAEATHTYRQPGTYRPTLHVSNSDDFATKRSLLIDVMVAPRFETTLLPTGLTPVAAEALDLNNDQRQDLVSANASSHTISVFVLDEDQYTTSPYQYPAIKAPSPNPQPQFIAVGDINHDTLPDLVVLNAPDDNLTLLFGNGIGGFQTPSGYHVPKPGKALIGDFNGDFKRDVLVVSRQGNTDKLVLMVGRATGELTLGDSLFDHPWITDIDQSDLNNDGLTDLVLTTDTLSVDYFLLINNGQGFDDPVSGYLPSKSRDMALMDFNFDGRQDLVSVNRDGSVSLLQNDGSGEFTEYDTLYPKLSSPSRLLVADANGDHLKDLVIEYLESGERRLAVLLGNGSGKFTKPVPLSAFAGYQSALVADLNGDRVDDLVAVNPDSDELMFGLNVSQSQTD